MQVARDGIQMRVPSTTRLLCWVRLQGMIEGQLVLRHLRLELWMAWVRCCCSHGRLAGPSMRQSLQRRRSGVCMGVGAGACGLWRPRARRQVRWSGMAEGVSQRGGLWGVATVQLQQSLSLCMRLHHGGAGCTVSGLVWRG